MKKENIQASKEESSMEGRKEGMMQPSRQANKQTNKQTCEQARWKEWRRVWNEDMAGYIISNLAIAASTFLKTLKPFEVAYDVKRNVDAAMARFEIM